MLASLQYLNDCRELFRNNSLIIYFKNHNYVETI